MRNSITQNLSKEQVRLYHQQGWLGPFTLISESEMKKIKLRIDREILEPGKPAQLEDKPSQFSRKSSFYFGGRFSSVAN